MRCSCENAKREARREALEEAAELVDAEAVLEKGHGDWQLHDDLRVLANEIRLLKDKPE